VIVNILPEVAVTSTISSIAVSGLITMVNVSPPETPAPPNKADADTTVAEVAVVLSAPVNVVCWERDEYLRVVISYLSTVVDTDGIFVLLARSFLI
jgi:hypothetical protein